MKSNIDTPRTAHINFFYPFSAQAQQARKIDMSNTVEVLGYFDYTTHCRLNEFDTDNRTFWVWYYYI